MELIPDFVPSGYKTVNVYLIVNDAEKALRFYNSVFDADLLMVLRDPDGKIAHSEFKVYDTIISLKEEVGIHPAGTLIKLYTGDAEEVFNQCEDQGCEVISPLKEGDNGDIEGRVKDPFGHEWIIARHLFH